MLRYALIAGKIGKKEIDEIVDSLKSEAEHGRISDFITPADFSRNPEKDELFYQTAFHFPEDYVAWRVLGGMNISGNFNAVRIAVWNDAEERNLQEILPRLARTYGMKYEFYDVR